MVSVTSYLTSHAVRFGPAILALFGIATACGVESGWRPAPGPLMTHWAAGVSPTNAHPEYPRPQLVRKDWLNLNGLWDYAITASDSNPPSAYEGQILVPFPIESALSGVMRRLDEHSTLWYRRHIALPHGWRSQRIRLHFGAVDWQTRVFINGEEVGRHRGGYDAFGFDITAQLGWNGKDEIVVAVNDPTEGDQPRGKQSRKPEGIFYTPTSGIWQTVWLEPVPEVCIDGLKLTPDVDAKALMLRVAVNSLSEKIRVEAVALADGKEVARATGLANAELVVPLTSVRLWSPKDPFLYELRVTLKDKDQARETISSYFGMRKISLRKDAQGITRIALNDEFVYQVGVLDQGFWPDGIYTAPTDEALRSDIEFVKSAGFNLIRKHVKVEPARWYYWCDQLGLLVWQDMPSGNNATPEGRRGFESELRHMIRNLENHPSIIAWVIFNEGWGQYDTERLTQWVAALDPTRLVNNASGWTDMRVGDLVDLHSYPGPDSPDPEPRRAAALGEFGGLGFFLEDHSWSPRSWGYLMLTNRAQLAAHYERLLKQVWALHDLRGLSAAIYTQTTDVETECNGLLTYDRAVTKTDPAILLAANRGELPGRIERMIVPDAKFARTVWKYTTQSPGEDWFTPAFDDSTWKEGPAAFGASGTPGLRANTHWLTSDIWLRHQFALKSDEIPRVKLRVYHDEDTEIYLNGVLAAKLGGFVTEYIEVELSPEAIAALQPGNNTVAVHCHQTVGGQGIDVGIVLTRPRAHPGGKPAN